MPDSVTRLKRMMQLKPLRRMKQFALSSRLEQVQRTWDHPVHDVGVCVSNDEWITGPRAADLLGVHRSTMLRILNDPAAREREFGAEGEGWRLKPLSSRGVIQVRRSVVEAKLQPHAE
ncbi:hypothetical protein [Phytohabitans aurantiacus]|nr:hypothetical protein [Phytohabitans aurantiacus]